MLDTPRLPGRQGMVEDRGYGCRNGQGGLPPEWGVRVGSASGDPGAGHNVRFHNAPEGRPWDGGYWLTADEAESLASHLTACAAWARAQNGLDGLVAPRETQAKSEED